MSIELDSASKFSATWSFTRTLTIDLLRSLDDGDLAYSPGVEVGPLWKQFRHIGRVQEDYLTALDTRSIQFTCENKTYAGGADKEALSAYLKCLDEKMFARLKAMSQQERDQPIDWFGESVDLDEHFARLISHETLHHGQLIVYRQLQGKGFPPSWEAWGF